MKTGYLRDVNGQLICNTNYIKYIINDEGKGLQEILDSLSYTSDIEPYSSKENFPQTGNPNHLYIDEATGNLYIWKDNLKIYYRIGLDYSISDSAHVHNNKEILDSIKYALDEELKTYYDSAVQEIYIGNEKQLKEGSVIRIPSPTGAISEIINNDLKSNAVIISDENGKLTTSIIDVSSLEALLGVNNNIQDQLNVLSQNISGEVQRATNAENTLSESLNSEIQRANNVENSLSESLNNEIQRAIEAENVITENLDNEIQRAKEAENVITTNLNNEIQRATEVENTLSENLNNEIQRAKEAENDINLIINSNKSIWEDKYTKNEIDNKFSLLETSIDWKEAVETFDDIAITYPEPEDGWTVNVKDTDITYRWNGTKWIAISANSIPKATSSVDGLLSKEDKVSYDDANSKKHTHNNKSIIDKITQSLLDNWNAAYTHISDTVKHITSSERTLWNTVSNKVDKIEGKGLSTNDFTTTYKNKLDSIANGAEVNVQSDWNVTDNTSDAFIKNKPTNVSQFNNDAGYITSADIDTSQNHTHTNKTVLDKITQAMLDKLNGIAEGANKYIHPTYTPKSSGLYKITVDDTGHVSGATAVVKSDITALGIPAQDTNTHFESKNIVGNSTAIENTNAELANGNVYLKSIENGAETSSHKISGTGATTVTTDNNGNILINSINTDTKVTQTNTTTSNDYRVILSTNANDTTETNTLRKNNNFLANPNTGEFYAKGYRRTDITGKTVDINDYNLASGSPNIMYFIEKTDGGSGNITNIPVSGKPFLLTVELIRWASTSDYITKQIFESAYIKKTFERYCTNGTWSSWLPISNFTATPVSGQVLISDGTQGGIKTSGYTIAKSVPSNAIFTDTTYNTGTSSISGITKLYTGIGSAIDGTMTQAAITNALNGKAEKPTNITTTILLSGWSDTAPYTCAVTVNGMTENGLPDVLLANPTTQDEENDNNRKKSFGYISYYETSSNKITFTCKYNKPTIDLPILIKGVS